MKWNVLSSEYLHREPWLTIRKDSCETPAGKKIPAFYVNEYPEWVNAFALTEEGEVVMVRQYRHGVGRVDLELPGGVAEEGEDMQEACARELKEETGYEFSEWEYLGKICANPSTTNNYMHMFLARGGKKVTEQSLDETEELEVVHCSLEEVKTLVKENRIVQSLHTNCIFYALHRLGALSY
ncbi:MAG TPA: NUDIX hydrolase [Chitinophagaceae bacterium]|nr:NUDIX hydrolase [Chitinophagaceae bacterium]